jgi:hypothetical protein
MTVNSYSQKTKTIILNLYYDLFKCIGWLAAICFAALGAPIFKTRV